jgi:hypothetical protein
MIHNYALMIHYDKYDQQVYIQICKFIVFVNSVALYMFRQPIVAEICGGNNVCKAINLQICVCIYIYIYIYVGRIFHKEEIYLASEYSLPFNLLAPEFYI